MIRERDAAVDAEQVGIDALAFLASHDDLMRRFLDVTGLEVGQLRGEAGKPAFFVGVLDFILANEDDVLDFAGAGRWSPATVGRVRNELARQAGMDPVDLPG